MNCNGEKLNSKARVEPYVIWQLSVAVADFTIHVCKGVWQIYLYTKNHIEEDPFYINLFTLYTLKNFTKVGNILL